MPANQEPLKAVSNVIELKPDKKYLLVITAEDATEGREFLEKLYFAMREQGIHGFGISLRKTESLEVIEIPEETSHASKIV